MESERYVLLQTYTISNISAGDITGIEFYQMLHGHPADEGNAEVYSVYEAYPHSDALANYTPFGAAHTVGNFQFDITQWNTGNGEATHVDWLAFSTAQKPDWVENGYYEGGHSYDPYCPPEGTHKTVEAGSLNGHPYSFGEVAGAMGWNLGTLEPSASVSLTIAVMFGAGPIVVDKASCEPPVGVANWKFDEASGTTAVDSIGSNDGTLTGDPIWVTGHTGLAGDYALDFDGDDYVALKYPVNVLAGRSVTISAWVKPAPGLYGGHAYPIVAQNGISPKKYWLYLSGYKPAFYHGSTTVESPMGLDNEWHHIMGTYDGALMRLYVDGLQAGPMASCNVDGVYEDVFIGSSGPVTNKYFKGQIDDVWIYGCALDPTTDCLPLCHKDYGEWAHVGKPACWCFPRQCHGDADGQIEGGGKIPLCAVSTNDLNILMAAWQIPEPPDGPGISGEPDVCADFDHAIQGGGKVPAYRVGSNDLNILVASWQVPEPPDGPGIPSDCLSCAGAGTMALSGDFETLTMDAVASGTDFAAITAWLEEVWLDSTVLEKVDEDQLMRLTESIAELLEK